jgi:hypothetical protein
MAIFLRTLRKPNKLIGIIFCRYVFMTQKNSGQGKGLRDKKTLLREHKFTQQGKNSHKSDFEYGLRKVHIYMAHGS